MHMKLIIEHPCVDKKNLFSNVSIVMTGTLKSKQHRRLQKLLVTTILSSYGQVFNSRLYKT